MSAPTGTGVGTSFRSATAERNGTDPGKGSFDTLSKGAKDCVAILGTDPLEQFFIETIESVRGGGGASLINKPGTGFFGGGSVIFQESIAQAKDLCIGKTTVEILAIPQDLLLGRLLGATGNGDTEIEDFRKSL